MGRDLIVLKLKPHMSCHLLDVYTGFQINIPKHVEKSLQIFSLAGSSINSPFEYFCPPEGQTLPKHDENQ